MLIEADVKIECDECQDMVEVTVQLTGTTISAKSLADEFDAEGWTICGDRHLCDTCSYEPEDDGE